MPKVRYQPPKLYEATVEAKLAAETAANDAQTAANDAQAATGTTTDDYTPLPLPFPDAQTTATETATDDPPELDAQTAATNAQTQANDAEGSYIDAFEVTGWETGNDVVTASDTDTQTAFNAYLSAQAAATNAQTAANDAQNAATDAQEDADAAENTATSAYSGDLTTETNIMLAQAVSMPRMLKTLL